MSLFKILKGDSSRIDMSITPFHDGYAYFTPDDGGFYIDSEDNGEQKRIRINPKGMGDAAFVYTAVLFADGWTGSTAPYMQTVTAEGMRAEDVPIADLVQTGIEETDAVLRENVVLVTRMVAGDNEVTAYASEIPTVDLPIQMIAIQPSDPRAGDVLTRFPIPSEEDAGKLLKVSEFGDYELGEGLPGLPEPTVDDAGKAIVVQDDGSYGLGEVETNIAVDQTVVAESPNPVSGAAVANYAFPRDMIVATTVDPGEGAVVDYPDGTVILVYE